MEELMEQRETIVNIKDHAQDTQGFISQVKEEDKLRVYSSKLSFSFFCRQSLTVELHPQIHECKCVAVESNLVYYYYTPPLPYLRLINNLKRTSISLSPCNNNGI
jgi:hypothetical protein